jgi:hypothetical protein
MMVIGLENAARPEKSEGELTLLDLVGEGMIRLTYVPA